MASSTRTAKQGVSLAKGPVALLGALMLAYGIVAFLLGGNGFSASPPSGDVDGDTFLGIEGNGWTNLLWAAGGALLLFGSPFHWGAKSTALIVGLSLGAASVIAMFDGWARGDALGIFATNPRTILALGVVSAALLLTALLPRVGKHRGEAHTEDRHRDHDRDHRHDHDHEVARGRTTAAAATHEPHGERDPQRDQLDRGPHIDRQLHRDHEPHTDREPDTDREPHLDRDPQAPREPALGREDEGRFDRAREGALDPQVEAAREAERDRHR